MKVLAGAVAALAALQPAAAQVQPQTAAAPSSASVSIEWGAKARMADGVVLNATIYRPRAAQPDAPCIVSITPYISDTYHNRGIYFAGRGLPYIQVDSRGRGNSGGEFRPFYQEIADGPQIIEWAARQPGCNGKVGMWGGSYAGTNQWATAKGKPAHLSTIVPVASAFAGVDFPMRNNIAYAYILQWLTYTAGSALQSGIFADQVFWAGVWLERAKAGAAFETLPQALDVGRPVLAEWLKHPTQDSYWEQFSPSAAEYARMDFPILTITGSHDDDQPGALEHYRRHLAARGGVEKANHWLVIGPWDHAATRTPRAEMGGVTFGPASLVDLPDLHVQWYRWTMADGPKPAFLSAPVRYYVMGAERWRDAPSLEAVTARRVGLPLGSSGKANLAGSPGTLGRVGTARFDSYVYDPRKLPTADVELAPSPDVLTDDRMWLALDGQQLVYVSQPFPAPTELSGFFRLVANIAIDQPDTDIVVSIHELKPDGSVILLTTDQMRGRHREGLGTDRLVPVGKVLPWVFDRFTFVSREIAAGSRLRLTLAPNASIATQRNLNSARPVSQQTLADARPVTVRLVHDRSNPSILELPYGRPDGERQ